MELESKNLYKSKEVTKKFILDNYRTMSIAAIAERLKLTDSYIRQLFKESGIESSRRKAINGDAPHSSISHQTALRVNDIKKDTLPKLDRNETPATGRMHRVDSRTYVFKTWAQLKEMGIEI